MRASSSSGPNGFGKRPWKVAAVDGRSVTLKLASPDGDAGYPGNLAVELRYTVEAPSLLRMEATATTDKPTAVNLAQHTYFNLDDSPDILAHHVQIFADAYTPTDADKVPTGEIAAVAGTPFDLRTEAPIGRMVDGKRRGLVVAVDSLAVEEAVRSRAEALPNTPAQVGEVAQILWVESKDLADLPRQLGLEARQRGRWFDPSSPGGLG